MEKGKGNFFDHSLPGSSYLFTPVRSHLGCQHPGTVHKVTGSPVTAILTSNLFVPLITIPSASPLQAQRKRLPHTKAILDPLQCEPLLNLNFLIREVVITYFL